MGTPAFAVPSLQALLETQNVVGVVTQPDRPAGRGGRLQAPPVKETALAAGVPVYQPRSLRSEEAADPLRDWAPDVIVVAAFGQILRPHVLYLPPHGSVNVHASLLPRWRGASPIQHAILAGDDQTGITVMRMDEGLDTGPTYVQERVDIESRETAETLHDKLSLLGAEMASRHLDAILDGRLTPVEQDDSLSTYAPMIKKEAGRIDWNQSCQVIDRHIRAMSPWPGATTTYADQMLRVRVASPLPYQTLDGPPGRVSETGRGIAVATGDGALLLETIQLAGKRQMTAEAFLRGHSDFAGSVLGSHEQ